MSENIQNNNDTIKITDTTIFYFQEYMSTFDVGLLEINIKDDNINSYYDILLSYSYDKINYSEFLPIDEFINPTDPIEFVIAIQFKKNVPMDLDQPGTLYQNKNVEGILRYIEITTILYNAINMDIFKESVLKIETISQLINRYPIWNFYDGQQVTINRWLDQCDAIAEMYGHTCVYFRTVPVESETIHTFANHVIRNVVSIKKLHINLPNNEIPQDKVIYSDWDMPLQDDFLCHIVRRKFEIAFGEGFIPSEKDYIYFPMLNKLFRVSAVQPKNSFMGKIGWWEAYLAKYEEDETVTFSEGLKQALATSEDLLEPLTLFNELDEIIDDTLITEATVAKDTIEEKKQATQNYTNKLIDSTTYVSLKETEKIRQYYNNRLEIVSINPDTNSYPVNLYDNTKVENRTLALQYALTDFITKNNFSLTVDKSFTLSFDFVLLSKFSGELFSLLSGTEANQLTVATISLNRNKLDIVDTRFNETFNTNFQLELNEYLNVLIDFNFELKQYSLKIFKLSNSIKTLVYQNIYIIQNLINIANNPFDLTFIQIYGGKCYTGNTIFNINNNKIFNDKVNPLLVMRKF